MSEFEFYRSAEVESSTRIAELSLELASLGKMKKLLSSTENPSTERLIIGSGAAGTLLYKELRYDKEDLLKDEEVMILGHPIHLQHWALHGPSLMGQRASLQMGSVLGAMPTDYAEDVLESSNPYGYVKGSDFNKALIQNQYDMSMAILPVVVSDIQRQEIEKNKNDTKPWEKLDYPYRVEISYEGISKYIYTQKIDLCLGLGKARHLSAEQIDKNLEQKLIHDNALIYAQDNSSPYLKGDILIFGGGAICGMLSDYILKTKNREQKLIKWVSRTEKDFDNTEKSNLMYQNFFSERKNRDYIGVGDILKVEEVLIKSVRN